jgi:small conductance mechanosensitive channel
MQRKFKMDEIVTDFLATSVKLFIYAFMVIGVLRAAGVAPSALIAAVGAIGLAIGLALKDSLSALASGILIAVNHLFRKGDHIEVGDVAGYVEKIGLFTTTVKTFDSRRVTLPNSTVFGSNLINYSVFDKRRLDLIVSIAYEDDLDNAKSVIEKVLDNSQRVLSDEGYLVGVESFGEYGVNILVRFWVEQGTAKASTLEVLEDIKKAFDASSITIPYPRVDLVGFAEYVQALNQNQSELERAPEKVIYSRTTPLED